MKNIILGFSIFCILGACASTKHLRIPAQAVNAGSAFILNQENCVPEAYADGVWEARWGFICYPRSQILIDAVNTGMHATTPSFVSANPSQYNILAQSIGGSPGIRIVLHTAQSLSDYRAALRNGTFGVLLPGMVRAQSETLDGDGMQTSVLTYENCQVDNLMLGNWTYANGIICYPSNSNLISAIEGGDVVSAEPTNYEVLRVVINNRAGLRIVSKQPANMPFGGPSGYIASFTNGRFGVRYAIPQPVDPGPNNEE